MSSINDLGVFDQAVWSVLHGEFLLNTSQLNQPINWLGFHFHPILFLFVPLYALLPNVIWFTTAQAFALAIGAWPIFLLAQYVCQSEKVGFFWALAYMVNPFLLSAAAWDFHPTSLVVPFVATGMLAVEMKDFRLLILSSSFILICQEHLGIMVVGFGFLWGIRNRRWKQTILIVSLGLVYSILVLGIIMPELSSTGEHVMLSQGLGQLSRYRWLGGSLKEVFQTLLFHPIFVIKTVMLKMGGGNYLLLLLIFLCGLPLVAPEFILPGLADLSANMLSANPMPRAIIAYHTVCLVPVIIVAAVYGAERISHWSKKFSIKELASFVLIVSFVGSYFLSPFPLPGARNYWKPAHLINLPDPIIKKICSKLGKEISVSAQANIGAHFSQRHEIYRYPNMVGEADAIILRLESPTNNINYLSGQIKNIRKHIIGSLDSHLNMDRTEYIATTERLLYDKKYGVLLWNDPWLVMKKGKLNKEEKQVREIEQKLNQLRKEWKMNNGE
jgi:uncharacterized membrane protein